MAANIRSLVNGINPVVGASRNDLVVGDVVTLQSVDVATTYSWSIAFKPEGSAATFSGVSVNSSPGTFTVDLEGPYLIRLVTDIGLPSESQQFVRLRYLTVFGSLTLVSAGEQNATGVPVPVDATPTGWSDQQNFNLQTLLAYVATVSASGRVFYVDPTPGFGDYTTIQAAIDAAVTAGAGASTPWAILVRPGIYTEDLTLRPYVHVSGSPGTPSNVSSGSVTVRGTHVTTSVGVNQVMSVSGMTFETLTTTTSATITHASPGILLVDNCRVSMSVFSVTQGPAVLQEQGTLLVNDSALFFASGGASDRVALQVSGLNSSTLVASHVTVQGPSGALLNSLVLPNTVVCHFLDTTITASHVAGTIVISDAVELRLDYCYLTGANGVSIHPGAGAFAVGQSVTVRWSRIDNFITFDDTGIVGATVLRLGASEYDGITLPGGALTTQEATVLAESIFYDNSVSALTAENVQEAIDEIVVTIAGIPTTLDEAYDGGIPASGSGRTIIADAGAVQIVDSALPSPIPPAGSTDGRLQVVGAVEIGAIDEPEISLEPNPFGTGAVVRMGWTVVPANSPTAVGSPAILGRSTGTPLYRNFSLRVGTESTNGGGAVGNLFLAGGDGFDSGVTTPDGASVFLLAGSSFGGTGVAGNLYVAPGEGTTGNGQVVLAKPDTGTVASVTAAGVFVGGVTGDVTFALPTGSVTASILNTDNHAAVLVKLNALDGITAAGNPITVSTVAKGPAAFVYLLNTDPAGLDAALGVFQGQPMTAGAWTETVAVEASAAHEITIGAGGATGPLIYNSDTGKLTVPGLIDPTGMVFSRDAAPATGASEGAIFVSDGSGGLTLGSLYYRPASNGVPINISAGGGGGGGPALVSRFITATNSDSSSGTGYSIYPTDFVFTGTAQAISGLPLGISSIPYIYFDSNGLTGGANPWVLSGGNATVTSDGTVGTGYISKGSRVGRGDYYVEFECTTITGTDTRIGIADTSLYLTGTILGTTGLGYSSTGAVYAGAALPGVWGALTDGDVLGMYMQFINPDDPSAFGPGGYMLNVYFSINGVWQNGANPATSTNPIAFSSDNDNMWAYGVSLATTTFAQGTMEVIDAGALADGDYITIDGYKLTCTVSFRGAFVPQTAPGSVGDTLVVNVGTPGPTTLTLTGVAGARTPGADDFDSSLGTVAALIAEIVAAINDPLNSFAVYMLASAGTLRGNDVVFIDTIAPFTVARSLVPSVPVGSYLAYTMDTFINTGVSYTTSYGMMLAINGNNPTPSSLEEIVSASTVGALGGQIFLTSEIPGPAGDAIALTTSNALAITVPANLSGGVDAPVITVRPDPSTPWAFPPGIGELAWIQSQPSNATILIFPSPFGPPVYPADFNVTQVYPFPTSLLAGRSIVIQTDALYDGGDVSITFIRSDTAASETRVINIVPGVDVEVNVPIQVLTHIENLGGPFNNGTLSVVCGDWWGPTAPPASNVGGVITPSPISSVPAPTFFIQDRNTGFYLETPTIGGEDNNMVDVYSLTHYPSPSGDIIYFGCSLTFVVTNAP
jgi:hypothetical protein